MPIKTLTAPLALMAALGLGATAHAQTMIGEQEVSDADLLSVTEHCRTLAMGSDVESVGNSGNPDKTDPVAPTAAQTDLGSGGQATTGNEGNPDNDMPDPAMAATADRTTNDTSGVSGNPDNETQLSGAVNMEIITLSDCQAAGLL